MSSQQNNSNDKRISRACVFIDSSNPSMPSQVINNAQSFIRPPFPPTIEPRDLLKRRDGGLSKAPNAFIIYRKSFIATARSDGYYLPMTVISSMASQSWEQEPDEVKAEYRRLAKEAFNLRNEMLPKSIRRRKREKWNIVSFEDDGDKLELRSESIKPKSTTKKSSNKEFLKVPKSNQSLLSPISSPEPLSIESSPISPAVTPAISPLISPKISPSPPHSPHSPSFINYNRGEELAQLMIPSPIKSTFDETFVDGMDNATEFNNNTWFQNSETSSTGSLESNEQYLLDLESSPPTFDLMISQFGDQIDLMLERQQNHFTFDSETNQDSDLFSQGFLTEPSSGIDFEYSYYVV